jgi:hypothetical protein
VGITSNFLNPNSMFNFGGKIALNASYGVTKNHLIAYLEKKKRKR